MAEEINQDKEELARWKERSELELERLRNDVENSDIDYSSTPASTDNYFSLFREIMHTKDSKKIGFLTNAEIGGLGHSVRRYLELSLFSDKAFGYDKVSNYFAAKAEIIAATSMSRKGSFLKTIVTKIRTNLSPDRASMPENNKWWQKKNDNKAMGDELD